MLRATSEPDPAPDPVDEPALGHDEEIRFARVRSRLHAQLGRLAHGPAPIAGEFEA
ncbi:MAG: hypothetical protein ACE37F_34575 [Nannocystaceae bacterium]|nr:hypothetical protein [bacterium]